MLRVAACSVEVVGKFALQINQTTTPRAVGVLIEGGNVDRVSYFAHGSGAIISPATLCIYGGHHGSNSGRTGKPSFAVVATGTQQIDPSPDRQLEWRAKRITGSDFKSLG